MRKVRQTLVPTPKPLVTCPGLRYWQPYVGSPYWVLVDESFSGFFEFQPHGYFVHAAVGIPEASYEALKSAIAPIFEEYRRLTSPGQQKFRHAEFKRLKYRDRRRLATRIRNATRDHGAFVNVFYTPLRSFVLEHVRTRLFHEPCREIPGEFARLYEEARTELKAEMRGPGQSALIQSLLLLPVGAVANILATFRSQFTVVYDPREKREDKAVISAVDQALAVLLNLKGRDVPLRWELHTFVKGFVRDRRSEQEIGLQLADLMAGETRAFFVANPALMEFAASRKLITQGSFEPVVTVEQLEGALYKTGALSRIPGPVRRAWLRQDPDGRTVFPLFRELLGAGVVTCYSTWGQPQHIALFDGYMFDQVE